MDTTDSSPSRPEVAAGDPSIAAGRPCFLCRGDGLVYIGRLEITDEGEEIEDIESRSCRRCRR